MRHTSRCSSDLLSRLRVLLATALLLLFNVSCGTSRAATAPPLSFEDENSAGEIIESITYKDADGHEHEEFAFRAPMVGLPRQVLEMFCASIKMRLYWDVFRDEIKSDTNKGINLRRLTRLAKHIFDDLRDVDKPFEAKQLSKVDEYFGVGSNPADNDDEIEDKATPTDELAVQERLGQSSAEAAKKISKPKSLIRSLKGKFSTNAGKQESEQQQAMAAPSPQQETFELESVFSGEKPDAKARIKAFVREWAPKVTLGIYTRIRTMWWMVTACLFTKYYLWNPALDEFTKLKRSLVMWPDLQLLEMQDLQCKPIRMFRRVLDVCKLLNPLLRIDFGQLSLD